MLEGLGINVLWFESLVEWYSFDETICDVEIAEFETDGFIGVEVWTFFTGVGRLDVETAELVADAIVFEVATNTDVAATVFDA